MVWNPVTQPEFGSTYRTESRHNCSQIFVRMSMSKRSDLGSPVIEGETSMVEQENVAWNNYSITRISCSPQLHYSVERDSIIWSSKRSNSLRHCHPSRDNDLWIIAKKMLRKWWHKPAMWFCNKKGIEGEEKKQNVPMPSRMDRFGLMISLELTRNISPMYRWFVGTKTLHNSSSSFSFYGQQSTSRTKKMEFVKCSLNNIKNITL